MCILHQFDAQARNYESILGVFLRLVLPNQSTAKLCCGVCLYLFLELVHLPLIL